MMAIFGISVTRSIKLIELKFKKLLFEKVREMGVSEEARTPGDGVHQPGS